MNFCPYCHYLHDYDGPGLHTCELLYHVSELGSEADCELNGKPHRLYRITRSDYTFEIKCSQCGMTC